MSRQQHCACQEEVGTKEYLGEAPSDIELNGALIVKGGGRMLLVIKVHISFEMRRNRGRDADRKLGKLCSKTSALSIFEETQPTKDNWIVYEAVSNYV